jgi:hypothetical protein
MRSCAGGFAECARQLWRELDPRWRSVWRGGTAQMRRRRGLRRERLAVNSTSQRGLGNEARRGAAHHRQTGCQAVRIVLWIGRRVGFRAVRLGGVVHRMCGSRHRGRCNASLHGRAFTCGRGRSRHREDQGDGSKKRSQSPDHSDHCWFRHDGCGSAAVFSRLYGTILSAGHQSEEHPRRVRPSPTRLPTGRTRGPWRSRSWSRRAPIIFHLLDFSVPVRQNAADATTSESPRSSTPVECAPAP